MPVISILSVRFSAPANFMAGLLILLSCSGGGKKMQDAGTIKTGTSLTEYANRLYIERKEGYSLLQIRDPWQGAGNVYHTWYLVPHGSVIPSEIDESRVINIPVRKIVCMSTTYLPMIYSLGEERSIIGVSGSKFIYNREIIGRSDNMTLYDVGYDENLNKELILSLSPDLVIAYGVGTESEGYIGKLRELGVRVLYNADYLEKNPLAKAEWIKLFGALFAKDSLAADIFRSVADEYNRLKEYISESVTSHPLVLLGLPYRDSWYISPGNSYIAELISDAGGKYIWSDLKSDITLPFSVESVFKEAVNADFWLNTGNASGLEEIGAIDPRFRKLECFQKGEIYNNNKRVNSEGGNDYWESGSLNPQIILRDIAAILHPELFPGYTFFYYQKLY